MQIIPQLILEHECWSKQSKKANARINVNKVLEQLWAECESDEEIVQETNINRTILNMK
jgi:hypothetical protein